MSYIKSLTEHNLCQLILQTKKELFLVKLLERGVINKTDKTSFALFGKGFNLNPQF